MVILSKNRYQNLTMDNLIINNYNRETIEYLKNYKENIEEKINFCENIILSSGVGLGKTYIIKAMLNDLQNKKIEREQISWESGTGEVKKRIISFLTTEYILMMDLIKALRADYDGNIVDRKFFDSDLLVIDEVGVQFGTEAERQIIFNLINYRYENFKPTIMLSNYEVYSSDDKKGLLYILGERIIDRMLCNGKILTIKGNSMRERIK